MCWQRHRYGVFLCVDHGLFLVLCVLDNSSVWVTISPRAVRDTLFRYGAFLTHLLSTVCLFSSNSCGLHHSLTCAYRSATTSRLIILFGNHPMCFTGDSVGIRLLCTYRSAMSFTYIFTYILVLGNHPMHITYILVLGNHPMHIQHAFHYLKQFGILLVCNTISYCRTTPSAQSQPGPIGQLGYVTLD